MASFDATSFDGSIGGFDTDGSGAGGHGGTGRGKGKGRPPKRLPKGYTYEEWLAKKRGLLEEPFDPLRITDSGTVAARAGRQDKTDDVALTLPQAEPDYSEDALRILLIVSQAI